MFHLAGSDRPPNFRSFRVDQQWSGNDLTLQFDVAGRCLPGLNSNKKIGRLEALCLDVQNIFCGSQVADGVGAGWAGGGFYGEPGDSGGNRDLGAANRCASRSSNGSRDISGKKPATKLRVEPRSLRSTELGALRWSGQNQYCSTFVLLTFLVTENVRLTILQDFHNRICPVNQRVCVGRTLLSAVVDFDCQDHKSGRLPYWYPKDQNQDQNQLQNRRTGVSAPHLHSVRFGRVIAGPVAHLEIGI